MPVSIPLDSSMNDLTSGELDVIVIGGGITGICVAREAASRGLSVALFEANDFGSGTSAATTKYIHGGIRYLEQYDIAVVRESLRERRVLALGAPHLVEQTRFIMPAWRWSKPPTALIGAGVLLYDALSFDRNRRAPEGLRIPHPRWLSRRRLLEAVPWLDREGLQGAFAYHDTMNIHPERLLLAYAKSATVAGARLFNHARSGRVRGHGNGRTLSGGGSSGRPRGDRAGGARAGGGERGRSVDRSGVVVARTPDGCGGGSFEGGARSDPAHRWTGSGERRRLRPRSLGATRDRVAVDGQVLHRPDRHSHRR